MRRRFTSAGLLLALMQPGALMASSHREAPFITKNPKTDTTDFYVFNSYEPGRAGYVTLISNYIPLQSAYGGPNFFTMDPDAIYEIHVDNNGDAVEDLTFQFDFDTRSEDLALMVGAEGAEKSVAVPFVNIGPVNAADKGAQNVSESYTIKVIEGDRRSGTAYDVTRAGGGNVFAKPLDNIGSKSIANYAAYAAAHVYEIDIPGCTPPDDRKPRVFVGQRKESFSVNLGQIFDLVNLDLDDGTPQGNPLGAADQGLNVLDDHNVTSIALEVPASCLTTGRNPVIGAWASASVRQARVLNPSATFEEPSREGGPWVQVSRLGMPLVNEVVIGIKDKDRFNGSEPKDDGQFADYVTHPTLAEVLEILFGAAGVQAPNQFPRADLVAAFLTGVEGVNKTASVCEYQRLNTAIAATPAGAQVSLGAAGCFDPGGVLDVNNEGCDPAGFPNGRRPGDDITDVALRVMMGYLLPAAVAPSGGLPFVDGAAQNAGQFATAFPYLTTPIAGAP